MSRRSPAQDEGQLFLFDLEEGGDDPKPEPRPDPKPRKGKAREIAPVAWVYSQVDSARMPIEDPAAILEEARRIPAEPHVDGVTRIVIQFGLDADPMEEGYGMIPTPYVTHGLKDAFVLFRRKGERIADFYLRRDPEDRDEAECLRQIERGIAELRQALGRGA